MASMGRKGCRRSNKNTEGDHARPPKGGSFARTAGEPFMGAELSFSRMGDGIPWTEPAKTSGGDLHHPASPTQRANIAGNSQLFSSFEAALLWFPQRGRSTRDGELGR